MASDRARCAEALAAGSEDHHAFRAAVDPLLRRAIGYDLTAWVALESAMLLFTCCDIHRRAARRRACEGRGMSGRRGKARSGRRRIPWHAWAVALALLAAFGTASGHDFEELAQLLFERTSVARTDCPPAYVQWLRDNALAGACATGPARFGAFASRFADLLDGLFGSHVEGAGPWRYREGEDLYERTFRHREGPYMAVRFVPARDEAEGRTALVVLVMTL